MSTPTATDPSSPPASTNVDGHPDGQPNEAYPTTENINIDHLYELIDSDLAEAVRRFGALFRDRRNDDPSDELHQFGLAFVSFFKNVTHPTGDNVGHVWEVCVSLSALYHEIVMTDGCMDEFPALFDYSIDGLELLLHLANTSSNAITYDTMEKTHIIIPRLLIQLDYKSHLLPVVDISIVERLFESSPSMFRHLWAHKRMYLGNDDHSQRRFRSLAKLINVYFDLCTTRDTIPPLETTSVIELLFLFWFHASPGPQEDGTEDIVLSRALDSLSLLGRQCCPPRHRRSIVEQVLLVEFGAEAYVDRFLRDIDEGSRIDMHLHASACAFQIFSSDAIVQVLYSRKAHIHIVCALKRQMERGGKHEQWETELQCRLWFWATGCLGDALTSLRSPLKPSPSA
ncbi:hypothetical protein OF83DRAFT_1177633 [Amylostereum chailletii]|nr:hypothetical protein OF83DRAFT_1177633 [Amylostereum chailletii]